MVKWIVPTPTRMIWTTEVIAHHPMKPFQVRLEEASLLPRMQEALNPTELLKESGHTNLLGKESFQLGGMQLSKGVLDPKFHTNSHQPENNL